jgi:hypothetical protein
MQVHQKAPPKRKHEIESKALKIRGGNIVGVTPGYFSYSSNIVSITAMIRR